MAEQRKQAEQQKKRTRFWEESSARSVVELAAADPSAIMAPPPATVNPVPGEAWGAAEGDQQAAAVAEAMSAVAEEQIFSLAKNKRLHCGVCSAPLKPPVFMCEDGHFVCSRCAGGRHFKHRGACNNRASSFVQSSGMDDLVEETLVPCCPFQRFGCRERSIPYYRVTRHMPEWFPR